MMSRIRLGHPYGQTPPNLYEEFEWVHDNREALLEKYGEIYIVVYQKQVIGTGTTRSEALEDAEVHLPAEIEYVTPILYHLYRRHPFLRIRPKIVENA